jgi:hypothetical protein
LRKIATGNTNPTTSDGFYEEVRRIHSFLVIYKGDSGVYPNKADIIELCHTLKLNGQQQGFEVLVSRDASNYEIRLIHGRSQETPFGTSAFSLRPDGWYEAVYQGNRPAGVAATQPSWHRLLSLDE